MEVSLLHFTPLDIALEAGLICTNTESKKDRYNPVEFLLKLVSQGHESIIEHINYNFRISGVSRALLQELARHRHISLSVQSTRWALNKITDNERVFSVNEESIDADKKRLLENLKKVSGVLNEQIKYAAQQGIPNDILKYYVQESLSTKLMLTLNARELRHIFSLRTSQRALKEFQLLCRELYNQLPDDHKQLYKEFFT